MSKGIERSAGLEGVKIVEGSSPVENVVRFEMFQELPVQVAYSWGKLPGADRPLNYSISQARPDPDTGNARTAEFLRKNGMGEISDLVLISPDYPPDPDKQILYVARALMPLLDSPDGVSESSANFLWTKEKGLVFGVKPADCSVYVLYGRNDRGEDVVGLGHLSYHLVDLNLGYDSVITLKGEGVDPKDMRVAIGPAIFMDNYSFPMHDRGLIKNDASWHGGLEERGDRLHLDLARATVEQLVAAGVSPQNIEIIIDNTFDAAKNREGFSDRYAKSTKDVDPNYQDGRMLFVAGLKD